MFQTLPSASFIVNGATPARLGRHGIAPCQWHHLVLAKFDGEFASHSSTYAGTGTVRYTW
jgi:hypothetical protein